MRQSTKLWIGAALLAASLSVVYVVTCDQKCRCALFPPQVPPPSDSVLYQIVRDTIEGKLRIDSIPYRRNEVILDRSHPKADSNEMYLKENCFVKVKGCDCAQGPELWRYAGKAIGPGGIGPIGVTDPAKLPPGKEIGGLSFNYILELPKKIYFDTIPAVSIDPDNLFSSTLKCAPAVVPVKVAVTDSGIDTIQTAKIAGSSGKPKQIINPLYDTKALKQGWSIARPTSTCIRTSSSYGINIFAPTTTPLDKTGHGTHVIGILLGMPDGAGNSKGVPFQLINVKMIEEEGDLFQALCGLYYALAQGAKVINISWGFKAQEDQVPSAIKTFVKKAFDSNVMIVAGLGNDTINLDSSKLKFWPACFAESQDNVISVGAVDSLPNRQRAPFSNWASSRKMTVAAWGVKVPSTYPLGLLNSTGFAKQSGTSMATPFVTRTVAVMYGTKPGITVAEIKNRIVEGGGDSRVHNHLLVLDRLCSTLKN